MAKITFSSRASCKIILHAAKYPHCAINGLLLAKQKSKDNKSELFIEDAVPLFHQCIHVSPMAEIALTLVDQYAVQNGLIIAGYYLANELWNDLGTDKPAHRIADKISEHCNNAILAVIDNRAFKQEMSSPPLRVLQHVDGKWKVKDKTDIIYDDGDSLADAIYFLLKEEKYQQLIDFDNHLDNISLDWHNNELNTIIKNLLSV